MKIKEFIKNIKIKEIINYKWVKSGKDTLQKKACKLLIAFLLLMILCTTLSRFADSLTIPVVKTDKPKTRVILDEVKVDGRIVKNREDKITVLEGLKVDYVNVNIGSMIKEGDVLVELNIKDLQKKVDELNKSISTDQKTLSRAQEDYNKSIALKTDTLNRALSEMNSAKKALEDYKLTEEKDEIMNKTLASEYDMKKLTYEELASSNDTVELDRILQDTKDSIKLEEYNSDIAKIKPFLEAEGKIKSTQAGIVTNVFVENGGVTTDAIVSLANEESGFKFAAQIGKEKKNLIRQGQKVTVSLPSDGGNIEGLIIQSITASKENPEMLDIEVMLPTGIGEIDDIGEIMISDKSKKFGTCVPIKALRQDEDGSYYILTIIDKETVLGSEKVSKKIPVRIEKKDGEYAAVTEGSIARDEVFIISSNKKIEDGDRVRLETE